VFRELGYGVLFFIATMLGALLGVGLFMPPFFSFDPEDMAACVVLGAILGANVGGFGWLAFKRKYLTPS
jgi:hypothetical protein